MLHNYTLFSCRWSELEVALCAHGSRFLFSILLPKQRTTEESKRQDAEHEKMQNAHARAGMLMEREKGRREGAIRKQMADDNKCLSSQQKAQIEYLDKEVYTNRPTAGYFMQWNTTTR